MSNENAPLLSRVADSVYWMARYIERAENVARFVLERLAVKINDDRVQIYKVKCWETPTSVATYQVD